MEKHKNIDTFYAKDQAAWREWLAENNAREQSVWLIIYKKESGTPSVFYPEAVDEALCFGWIDSLPNKRNSESYYQFFSKRNPKSNWSRVNKEKVTRLIANNQMTDAGQQLIDIAKANNTWNALDEVENGIIPPDLQALFEENPTAFTHWQTFSHSAKRGILEWILNAKRPETREKRLAQTVDAATEGRKIIG